MSKSEPHSLLEDLFADEGAAQLRVSVLTEVLGAVRHRKRVRKLQGVASALVLLAAIPFAWWWNQPTAPVSAPFASSQPSYELVTTKVLAPERVVQTFVEGCPLTTTQMDGYAVIESMDSRRFVRELDDDGLLGMFAGRTVALVYRSPSVAELIFADGAIRSPTD